MQLNLSDYDAIVFDMDGTLYREHAALPGVAEFIAHLNHLQKPFACLTNASAYTSAELSARLKHMGVPISPAQIYTAGNALVQLIRRHSAHGKPRVCNFAGPAVASELGDDAVWVTTKDAPCDVVAVATHRRPDYCGFEFDDALVALHHLRHGAAMIVGCADRVFPTEGGGVEFGCGAWASLFATAAEVPPERVQYAGKPQPAFFNALCTRLEVVPQRCLLIGDNLESDIRGALGVGMTAALVLSGVTPCAPSPTAAVQPHAVYKNLAHLHESTLQKQ